MVLDHFILAISPLSTDFIINKLNTLRTTGIAGDAVVELRDNELERIAVGIDSL